MRFRSSTRVENTVEMYEALTAVYQPIAISPAAKTEAKTRSASERGSSRRRKRAASPATTGSTPRPIVSAPAAQSPYSIIRWR